MRFVRLTALGILVLSPVTRAQQQPPRFQSSTEVISLDVAAVDDRGRPVQGLAAADFNVRVDGQPRRVISADFISQSGVRTEAVNAAVVPGYASNGTASGGRLIVMAFDQTNIPFTAIAPLDRKSVV